MERALTIVKPDTESFEAPFLLLDDTLQFERRLDHFLRYFDRSENHLTIEAIHSELFRPVEEEHSVGRLEGVAKVELTI